MRSRSRAPAVRTGDRATDAVTLVDPRRFTTTERLFEPVPRAATFDDAREILRDGPIRFDYGQTQSRTVLSDRYPTRSSFDDRRPRPERPTMRGSAVRVATTTTIDSSEVV